MPAGAVAWSRVILVLGLVAVLTVGAVLSPAGAGRRVTRGFVKKLVTNRIDSLRNELGDSIRATRTGASSSQRLGPFPLSGTATDVTVLTVAIPDAGNYVVMAKLWWTVVNATSSGVGGEIDCDLLAGDAFDTSRESGVTDFDYGTLSLHLTHFFSGPGTVTLRCRDEFQGGNPVEVYNAVITAFEMFEMSSTRVDRGTPAEPAAVGVRP